MRLSLAQIEAAREACGRGASGNRQQHLTPGASQVEARRVALLVLAQMSNHLRDEVRTPVKLADGWRDSA